VSRLDPQRFEIGTLEVGKEADLAVLSQDIFSIPHDRIAETHVVVTLVGGKTVFVETK
jgi:predicted amidohydrolase YtcJ